MGTCIFSSSSGQRYEYSLYLLNSVKKASHDVRNDCYYIDPLLSVEKTSDNTDPCLSIV